MDAQLKRGLLEACVLTAMRGGESYGYKLIKDISPHIEISESTLYPILKRLEAAGCVTARSAAHGGRLRRYYGLTDTGRGRIDEFLRDWESVSRAYDYIAGGWEHDEE